LRPPPAPDPSVCACVEQPPCATACQPTPALLGLKGTVAYGLCYQFNRSLPACLRAVTHTAVGACYYGCTAPALDCAQKCSPTSQYSARARPAKGAPTPAQACAAFDGRYSACNAYQWGGNPGCYYGCEAPPPIPDCSYECSLVGHWVGDYYETWTTEHVGSGTEIAFPCLINVNKPAACVAEKPVDVYGVTYSCQYGCTSAPPQPPRPHPPPPSLPPPHQGHRLRTL